MKKPAKKPVKPKTVKTHSPSGSGTLRHPQRKASASGGLHRVSHRASASAPVTGAKKAAKKPVTAKKRQWSPGSEVACCSAEALGMLLGFGYEDVLALYWSTADGPDAGASILATLEAAQIQGTPLDLEFGWPDFKVPLILGLTLPEPHVVAGTPDGTWWSWGEPFNRGDWPELEIDEAWAVQL